MPKLHSKFCGRNLESPESPNLQKYPILQFCNDGPKKESLIYGITIWNFFLLDTKKKSFGKIRNFQDIFHVSNHYVR